MSEHAAATDERKVTIRLSAQLKRDFTLALAGRGDTAQEVLTGAVLEYVEGSDHSASDRPKPTSPTVAQQRTITTAVPKQATKRHSIGKTYAPEDTDESEGY